jgi:hypothetical protein
LNTLFSCSKPVSDVVGAKPISLSSLSTLLFYNPFPSLPRNIYNCLPVTSPIIFFFTNFPTKNPQNPKNPSPLPYNSSPAP